MGSDEGPPVVTHAEEHLRVAGPAVDPIAAIR